MVVDVVHVRAVQVRSLPCHSTTDCCRMDKTRTRTSVAPASRMGAVRGAIHVDIGLEADGTFSRRPEERLLRLRVCGAPSLVHERPPVAAVWRHATARLAGVNRCEASLHQKLFPKPPLRLGARTNACTAGRICAAVLTASLRGRPSPSVPRSSPTTPALTTCRFSAAGRRPLSTVCYKRRQLNCTREPQPWTLGDVKKQGRAMLRNSGLDHAC